MQRGLWLHVTGLIADWAPLQPFFHLEKDFGGRDCQNLTIFSTNRSGPNFANPDGFFNGHRSIGMNEKHVC